MSIQTETEKLLAYGNRVVCCDATSIRELIENMKPQEATQSFTYDAASGEDNAIILTGISEDWKGGKLVLPSSIDGFVVIQFLNTAFSKNEKITAVYFPDDLSMDLGTAEFYGCTNLKYISFGDNYLDLPPIVLRPTATGVAWLSTLYENDEKNISDNIVYLTSRSGKTVVAFEEHDIEPTKEYMIKDGTTIVGGGLFRHTANVTSARKVTVPRSVKHILGGAFCSTWTDTSASINSSPTVSEVRFEHGIGDELILGTGLFKTKNSANITIYHRNNPAVLNYDYTTDNVTPTFIEITD